MISRYYAKIKDIILHHILHVEDTPHRIALGAAVGIFIAWTPTFGLQTIIALALAAICRANKAVVFPMVWITNPVTNPAIYGFSYFVGHFLHTGSRHIEPAMKRQMLTLMKETMMMDIWHGEFWSQLMDVTWKIGLDLWIGSCVVGAIIAIVTYPTVYHTVIWYRRHRAKKKACILQIPTSQHDLQPAQDRDDAA